MEDGKEDKGEERNFSGGGRRATTDPHQQKDDGAEMREHGAEERKHTLWSNLLTENGEAAPNKCPHEMCTVYP